MNRRSFFRTATLSTMAVVCSKGQIAPPPMEPAATPEHPSFEADIADPSTAALIANSSTVLFARMEELKPADPGELSGALLRIHDNGESVSVGAGIGDILQSYNGGLRSSHFLGYLGAAESARFASIDPWTLDRDRAFFLEGCEEDDHILSGVYLRFVASDDDPELRLSIAGHCLGVLRGRLMSTFLDYLRRRLAIPED